MYVCVCRPISYTICMYGGTVLLGGVVVLGWERGRCNREGEGSRPQGDVLP